MHGESSSWFFQLPLYKNLLHISTTSSFRQNASHLSLFYTCRSNLTHIQHMPCRLRHTQHFCLGGRPPLVALLCPYTALSGSWFGPHLHNQQVPWMHGWQTQEEKFHLMRSFSIVPIQWGHISSLMILCLIACSWVDLSAPHHLCWLWWKTWYIVRVNIVSGSMPLLASKLMTSAMQY